MLVSDTHLILSNPRCGVGFLARYFGAQPVEGAARHLTPREIRKTWKALWEERVKIVPVRDPVERFVSAVRARWRENGQGEMPTDNDLAIPALAEIENGHDAHDRRLWPQSSWLKAKVDIILPLHAFQPFVAVHGDTGRKAVLGNEYPARAIALAEDTRARILSAYAEDVALFAKIPVWPSGGEQIHLMTGRCIACEKSNKPN
ncbi:hypothetical protein UFOVP783_47 [uncultured Caudovirales phage]|uniref:Sulfotransferase family protein n=1 Tax=uncultured Caudovirales phage TaxID=2100421 RepID=A0A6J5NSU7_9CAUD|nr:hypothetical protein UFOVP783_47 [uncultured Caudovirales phage]